jgi:hypothetical protein
VGWQLEGKKKIKGKIKIGTRKDKKGAFINAPSIQIGALVDVGSFER